MKRSEMRTEVDSIYEEVVYLRRKIEEPDPLYSRLLTQLNRVVEAIADVRNTIDRANMLDSRAGSPLFIQPENDWGPLDATEIAEVCYGDRIKAIQLYRTRMVSRARELKRDVSIKEAKEIVDRFATLNELY